MRKALCRPREVKLRSVIRLKGPLAVRRDVEALGGASQHQFGPEPAGKSLQDKNGTTANRTRDAVANAVRPTMQLYDVLSAGMLL